jgi:hypothetical protein
MLSPRLAGLLFDVKESIEHYFARHEHASEQRLVRYEGSRRGSLDQQGLLALAEHTAVLFGERIEQLVYLLL